MTGRPPGYLRALVRALSGASAVALAGLGLLPMAFDPAAPRDPHDRPPADAGRAAVTPVDAVSLDHASTSCGPSSWAATSRGRGSSGRRPWPSRSRAGATTGSGSTPHVGPRGLPRGARDRPALRHGGRGAGPGARAAGAAPPAQAPGRRPRVLRRSHRRGAHGADSRPAACVLVLRLGGSAPALTLVRDGAALAHPRRRPRGLATAPARARARVGPDRARRLRGRGRGRPRRRADSRAGGARRLPGPGPGAGPRDGRLGCLVRGPARTARGGAPDPPRTRPPRGLARRRPRDGGRDPPRAPAGGAAGARWRCSRRRGSRPRRCSSRRADAAGVRATSRSALEAARRQLRRLVQLEVNLSKDLAGLGDESRLRRHAEALLAFGHRLPARAETVELPGPVRARQAAHDRARPAAVGAGERRSRSSRRRGASSVRACRSTCGCGRRARRSRPGGPARRALRRHATPATSRTTGRRPAPGVGKTTPRAGRATT